MKKIRVLVQVFPWIFATLLISIVYLGLSKENYPAAILTGIVLVISTVVFTIIYHRNLTKSEKLRRQELIKPGSSFRTTVSSLMEDTAKTLQTDKELDLSQVDRIFGTISVWMEEFRNRTNLYF